MELRDIMQREFDVIAPNATLADAVQLMNRRSTTLLPVCEGRTLVGVLTARDLTVRATAEGRDPMQTQVRFIMTREVIYGNEDDSLTEILELLHRYRLRYLPIINRRGHLVGIVSRAGIHEHLHAA